VESIHLASEADTLRAEADTRAKQWMVETVRVRSVEQDDLPQLLSYGWMNPHDEVIQRAYDRSVEGDLIFLVAEADTQIIGQVWVDLAHLADEWMGLIVALFVVPTMQNLGLGTRLLQQAEAAMRERGLLAAEVSIEKKNLKARHLYARLGYEIVDARVKPWTRTTADGRVERSEQQSWIMHKTF
jgi:GNAT superfamily N-acetyltransferase